MASPGIDSKPSTVTSTRLRVTKYGIPLKARQTSQFDGMGASTDIKLHNSTIANLERGILERVFYCKNSDGVLAPPMTTSEKIFNGVLGRYEPHYYQALQGSTSISAEQFACSYSGRKQARYKDAALSLQTKPLTWDDFWIGTFGKVEKTDCTLKSDPVQRVISAYSPRTIVETGRYFKPIEQPLIDAMDSLWGEPTIMKGYNADEIGGYIHDKWHALNEPVAVSLDVTRLDQHIGVPALKWEQRIYCSAYNDEEQEYFKWLLSGQLEPRGRARCKDGHLRYSVNGTRTSGCNNTGTGNCLIVSTSAYDLCKRVVKLVKFSAVDNGDDITIFMERRNLRKFLSHVTSYFAELGLPVKVEKIAYTMEHIDFCQTRPVRVGDKARMVRIPKTSLSKDATSIKPLTYAGYTKKWMEAIGKGGQALTDAIPILPQYYQNFVDGSASIKLRSTRSRRVQQRRSRSILSDPEMSGGLKWLSKRMEYSRREVSLRTAVSFWEAFGYSGDEQLLLTQYYSSMTLNYREQAELRSPVANLLA